MNRPYSSAINSTEFTHLGALFVQILRPCPLLIFSNALPWACKNYSVNFKTICYILNNIRAPTCGKAGKVGPLSLRERCSVNNLNTPKFGQNTKKFGPGYKESVPQRNGASLHPLRVGCRLCRVRYHLERCNVSPSTQDWAFQKSIRLSFTTLVTVFTVRLGEHACNYYYYY